MKRNEIDELARQLLAGTLSTGDFADRLLAGRVAELSDTTLDLDRARRCGFPEVVFGEGKSVESLTRIIERLRETTAEVLVTRVTAEKAAALRQTFPEARYNEQGRTFRLLGDQPASASTPATTAAITKGRVAIVTAGTSDLPVAEEARETLDWMGIAVTMIHDVGVAGPHRLPRHVETLRSVDVVVVVAGMEAALPSVVGGYVDCPVIGVPTSVGYGASFGGVAALLGMLNSCASNVTVVNIDAGFKGAYVAGLIARRRTS